MHFQVWIAPQPIERDERCARAACQAIFRASIAPLSPRGAKHRADHLR
jgi:hypothetical protein